MNPYVAVGLCQKDNHITKNAKFRRIVKTVTAKAAKFYGMELTVKQVFENGRKRPYISVKHIMRYFIVKYMPCLTLKQVAYKARRSDHSTIIHSVNWVNSMLSHHSAVKELILDIDEELTYKVEYNKNLDRTIKDNASSIFKKAKAKRSSVSMPEV